MNLVFFTHPSFLGSQSMPRYAQLLTEGMKIRGHSVEVWSPNPRFYKLPLPTDKKKWLGYLDQFIVFPREVYKRLKKHNSNTLFVFTDQALGPWVPLVADQPHVIHCHDFLAQRSALGQIPENPISWTGRQYQSMIRRGYSCGKHFICGSEKTREDLHYFLRTPPASANVVDNGFNQPFAPCNPAKARGLLGAKTSLDLSGGYLLHVGGNQWYKNRVGVIEIYDAWRAHSSESLPLLMAGRPPSDTLLSAYKGATYRKDIHFLCNLSDEAIQLAYGGASLLLFPSLAEGFGWPIAEAMACGCPVITTNEAPMSAVAGKAGFLIPRKPMQASDVRAWAIEAGIVIKQVLELSPEKRRKVIEEGIINSKRFDTAYALDRIESIYKSILQPA